ncbi:MAG: AAA family ATPase [Myxococcota bacterium]
MAHRNHFDRRTTERRELADSELERLVGRERELEVLRDLLDTGAKVVTVTGAPGIGKTAVVDAYAARADSICFDVAEVGSQIDDMAHRSTGAKSRNLLIVIHHAECDLERTCAAIRETLSQTPRTAVLVSSRTPLGLAQEHVVRLGPLALPLSPAELPMAAASRLFVAQTRQARPTWRLRDNAGSVLVEILATLDGVPLAIQMAAECLEYLSLDEVRRGLTEKTTALESQRRDRPRRHRSFECAVECSLALLSPVEREALRRFGMCPGGCDRSAADALLSDLDTPTDEILSTLVRQSLLERDELASGRSRYRVLQCIADVVATSEATPRPDVAIERFAEHRLVEGLRLSVEFRDSGCSAALAVLREDEAQLLALFDQACAASVTHRALGTAIILSTVFVATGRLAEAEDVILRSQALHDADTECPSPERGNWSSDELERSACLMRGEILKKLGRGAEAIEVTRCLLGGPHDEFRQKALLLHASVERDFGSLEESIALAREAASGADSCIKPLARAVEGIALCMEGSVEDGEAVLSAACAALARAGSPEEAWARKEKGYVSIQTQRGDPLPDLERAAEVAPSSSRPELLGAVEALRAVYHHDGRDFEAAEHRYRIARDTFLSTGAIREWGVITMMAGVLDEERCQWVSARKRYSEAADALEGIGAYRVAGLCRAHSAGLDAQLGRPSFAARELERARNSLLRSKQPEMECAVLKARAAQVKDCSGEPGALRELQVELEAFESAFCSRSDDARAAHRILSAYFAFRSQVSDVLYVDKDAAWFKRGSDACVDMRKRGPMRRLLRCLFECALRKPGEFVDRHEIQSQAWPSEQMRADSADDRIRTTMSRLRRLGLDDALQVQESGFRLAPNIVVRIAPT